MDKETIGLIITSILTAFCLMAIIYIHLPKQEITFTKTNATIVTFEPIPDYYFEKKILEDKLQQIYDISYMNAQEHEYKLHEYDCTEFSKNLLNKLKNKGYKAQCTAGNNWGSDYTNHTWISIWVDGQRFEIESTSGEFIPDEYFEEGYYTIWKEGYCW